ncbi:MAG TPA: formate--tetrahydrofolate ligase [Acholeplasmataceae bacterium]|nr:formate--tetrahydrofolate ligase [Acholeplasmataceae bacterium]
MEKIISLCEKMGVAQEECIPYGFDKAKIDLKVLKRLENKKDGKLILVTAINPTPAGEGKTTVSIGLTQGLKYIGKHPVLALREPSLGPVFGLKGGATGGGKSIVVPSDDINLHFTGDLHAITAANNLLAALIDNHMFQGNELNIETVTWKRCMDMNDRNLREIETPQRKDGFVITAASEIMAILALATDLMDLKRRINNILIGYNKEGQPLFVRDLGGADALVWLLKDAMNPNLVQTIDGVPTFVHAGPFANIAHGCNSIVATKLALKLGDYAVTEAGFGADLGMEKFLDIKMPQLGKKVDAVVIVTTLRALKSHGGAEAYSEPNLEAMKQGLPLLEKHLNNINRIGLPVVIAVNHYYNDDQQEVDYMMNWAKDHHHHIALCDGFAKGGEGMVDLANIIVEIAEQPSTINPIYLPEDLPQVKIEKIAKDIYGAKEVIFSKKAQAQLETYEKLGWNLPVCMAKTPLSITGDPNIHGLPEPFTLQISEIKPSLGAGFLVALTKGIMVMPGLNKTPRALNIEIDADGNVHDKE